MIVNLSCSSISSQTIRNEVDNNPENTIRQVSKENIFSILKEEKIKSYGEWNVGEDPPLIYLVRKDGEEDDLSIADPSGKIMYEKKGIEVEKVYSVWALRTEDPQLVFEYSEGGSDSFLQMLNYNQGNISELIDSTKGENSFGADVKIQPQFRSHINPAKEPFEILLTDYGLASSAGKSTRVFRYKDNKYKYFGEFDREKVGDCKERFLTQ